jgi:hypothetical protein
MRPPVTHINLLQRTAPAHTAAWTLAALLALTLIGTVVHGSQLRSQAQEAMRRRDDVAQQLKQVQARLAIQNGEQVKSATALALRKEVDALQPQAQSAQALIDAVRLAEGGRTDEFARPLAAMTGLNEPGLWLTTLTLSAGGKRLELQGQAGNGASVLRFARRANESLQSLTLHLDGLEVQPAAGVAASGAGTGAVSFRLY